MNLSFRRAREEEEERKSQIHKAGVIGHVAMWPSGVTLSVRGCGTG